MYKTEYDDIKANLIKKSLERNEQDVCVPVERRKKIDGRINFINLICFLSWGAIFIVFALIIKAGKSIKNIVGNGLLWCSRVFWEVELLYVALYMAIACVVICFISILLNFTRHKRRNDKIKRSLIYSETISLIICIFLILKLF